MDQEHGGGVKIVSELDRVIYSKTVNPLVIWQQTVKTCVTHRYRGTSRWFNLGIRVPLWNSSSSM